MENEINISEIGIVSGVISGKNFSRIYSFVHDTSLAFNHFNNELKITKTSEHSFIKPYHYLGNIVQLKHEIQTLPNGILWKISRIEPFNLKVRFGITIPSASFKTENGYIEDIVNYSQHWRYTYKGQSNIDIPIVNCDGIYITVPLDNNVQFMFFENSFLKIATLDESDISLSVYFTQPISDDFRYDYATIHPEAANFVFIWKTLFEKIKTKYGITIHYGQPLQPSTFPSKIENHKLSRCADIIESALSIYPNSFLKKIPLSYISLCSGMSNNECVLRGRNNGTNILLNIELSDTELRLAIHHELFHFVSQDEILANFFSRFILDPSINKNNDTWQQLKYLFESYLNGQEQDEFLYFLNHRSTDYNTEIIKIHTDNLFIPPQEVENIFGISILDCFSIVREVIPNLHETNMINLSSLQKKDSLICFTINPLDYCELHPSDPRESMQFWIDFHIRCCEHKKVYFLNIESIHRKQWAFLKQFFAGFQLEINVENLQGFDIYCRAKKYSKPLLKEIWTSIKKHPILRRTGYNNVSAND